MGRAESRRSLRCSARDCDGATRPPSRPHQPVGMTTEVLVVRHGETAWNKEGRLQGQHDPPLNDQGRAQADAVARYLATQSRPSAAVYTSDLIRAEATAVAISERVGAKVIVKGGFREKGLGIIEELTFAEARV